MCRQRASTPSQAWDRPLLLTGNSIGSATQSPESGAGSRVPNQAPIGAFLPISGAIIHKLVFCVHYMNCFTIVSLKEWLNLAIGCHSVPDSSCLLSPTTTTIAICSRRRIWSVVGNGGAQETELSATPATVRHRQRLWASLSGAGKRALFQVIALWHEICSHGLFACLWPFN